MCDETNIPYYIAFFFKKELEIDQIKILFSTAKELLPDGIHSPVQVTSPDRGLLSVPLVMKTGGGAFRYYIPLSRNIIEAEAEPIVRAVSNVFRDLDFDVLVSKADIEDAPEAERIRIQDEKYQAICREYAKRQHAQWVEDRLKAGWRYGTVMSLADRTSPMLRSWDDLPESLRSVDFQHPQAMVDLLNDQGYAVVRKEELAAIYKLLHRNQ